jgi:DNA-binding GntR family transcriptional regulator
MPAQRQTVGVLTRTDHGEGMDESAAIRVPSIPDIVYTRLRREISTRVYSPGPISIKQLAEHFGVSAMPVREALRRLEAEGLVSFNSGRQVVINSLSLADIEEIFAIRVVLEELAIRTALPKLRKDEAGLAHLDRLLDEMDKSERASWRHLNREFHYTIYRAAKMPRLQVAIDSQWVLIEPYLPVYADATDGPESSQDQHREMVAAIRAGDASTATRRLRDQLRMTLERLRQGLMQIPEGS